MTSESPAARAERTRREAQSAIDLLHACCDVAWKHEANEKAREAHHALDAALLAARLEQAQKMIYLYEDVDGIESMEMERDRLAAMVEDDNV